MIATRQIELGGKNCAFALVDDADYPSIMPFKWYLNSHGYAIRKEHDKSGQRTIYLHREILGLHYGDPRHGDHINRDKLDCTRANLRIAPRGHADNNQNLGLYANNTSRYRGVTWNKSKQKWQAQCKLENKYHYLGLFPTAELADEAVKAFRAKHMPFSEEAQ